MGDTHFLQICYLLLNRNAPHSKISYTFILELIYNTLSPDDGALVLIVYSIAFYTNLSILVGLIFKVSYILSLF